MIDLGRASGVLCFVDVGGEVEVGEEEGVGGVKGVEKGGAVGAVVRVRMGRREIR